MYLKIISFKIVEKVKNETSRKEHNTKQYTIKIYNRIILIEVKLCSFIITTKINKLGDTIRDFYVAILVGLFLTSIHTQQRLQ